MPNMCPDCAAEIVADDLNMTEGVGLCRACGKLSRLGDIADSSRGSIGSVNDTTPIGCRVDDDGSRIFVRASARSVGNAAGLTFVCLFWNGIVSVFVLIAFAGLYTNLVGPLPQWFPAPTGTGSTSGTGSGGAGIPLGIAVFLCIFLIPFVTVGVIMLGSWATCIAGEVRVVLDGSSGLVSTGVGPLAWTRKFDALKVKRIGRGLTTWRQNDQSKPIVEIEADRTIKFGSLLSDERREWMIRTLRPLLVARTIRK